MIARKCPSRTELLDYLSGRMTENRMNDLHAHVDVCSDCEQITESFEDQQDPLMERLQGIPPIGSQTPDNELSELMETAKQLSHGASDKQDRNLENLDPPRARMHEYDLIEEIGRGGMGCVYRAKHRRLGRLVAVKLLAPHRLYDELSLVRFNREMQAIGALEHPNIVRAFDAGEDDGHMYLVMELVDGLDASQLLRRHGPLPVTEACEIVRQAAHGLMHAWQHGLVHRDIKPSNLLIGKDGVVKVGDLGLALLDEVAESFMADASELTSSNQAMGTIDYMAPEQASDSHRVDARADVYSLGCTLFKLLTGSAPYQHSDWDTPRKKFLAHQTQPTPQIDEFRDDVPRAVVSLVSRMMAKDPDQRIQTPNEVAEALEPWCDGADVAALVDDESDQTRSMTMRSGRPRRRMRMRNLVWLTCGLLLIGVSAFFAPLLLQPRSETDSEFAEEPVIFEGLGASSIAGSGFFVTVDLSSDGQLLASGSGFFNRPGALVIWDVQSQRERTVIGRRLGFRKVRFSPDGSLVAAGNFDATTTIVDTETGNIVTELEGHEYGVNAVEFSSDGKLLATASLDATAIIWDVTTWEPVTTLRGHQERVFAVAFSPDGRKIATGCADSSAKIWSVDSGEELQTLTGHQAQIEAVQFSPDGKTVATCGSDQTIRMWSVATGQEHAVFSGHEANVTNLAFTPDGTRLITISQPGELRSWDVRTGESIVTRRAHEGGPTFGLKLRRDGEILATASANGTSIRLWDPSSLEPHGELQRNRLKFDNAQLVQALAYSPDGKWIAAASDDHTVTIRNSQTTSVVRTLTGHEDSVMCVAFSPDGKHLASGSLDHTIRLWDTSTGKQKNVLRGHTNWIFSVAFAPDGRQLATSGYDKTIRIWNAGTGAQVAELEGHQAAVRCIAFSPDGKWIASGSSDRTARLWDLAKRRSIRSFEGHEGAIRGISFSPDGRTLATASEDATVRLWNPENGRQRDELKGHSGIVWSLAFSPRGRTLASGAIDGQIKLWNPVNGNLRSTISAHSDIASAIAFAPNSSALATGSYDKTIRIWRARRGSERDVPGVMSTVTYSLDVGDELDVLTLRGHSARIQSSEFSPDGQYVASASDDGTCRVWDLTRSNKADRTLAESTVVGEREKGIWWARFSRDGRRMAYGSAHAPSTVVDVRSGEVLAQNDPLRALGVALSPDGQLFAGTNTRVVLFDVRSKKTRRVGNVSDGYLWAVDFSPDGKLIAAAGHNREIQVVNVGNGEVVHTLSGHQDVIRTLRFSPDGSALVSAAMAKDPTVRIWDLATGQADVLSGHKGAVRRIDVSPDGSLIASASLDRTVKLWDLRSGAARATIASAEGCSSVGFSPDGRALAIGKPDGEISIVNVRIALRRKQK